MGKKLKIEDDNLFRDLDDSDEAPEIDMHTIMFYPRGFLNYLEMYPEERSKFDQDDIDIAKALTAFGDEGGDEKPSAVQLTLMERFGNFLKEQGNSLLQKILPYSKKKIEIVTKEGNSSDVYQSMQLTKLRYAFTTCEKNIFLKVVDVCQNFLKKEDIGTNCTFEVMNFKEAGYVPMITFPIKDILDENSTNYSWVKDRLSDLNQKKFGLPGTKDWDFREATLFQRVMSDKGSGTIGVILTVDFWEAFRSLECYKVINVDVAKKFKSIYAERIYEFLVGNKQDVIYEVKNLKLMFCLEEKYKNNGSFVKNTIIPAQKEMREMAECPFYFDYEIIYGARHKIEKIKFKVINKEQKVQEDADLQFKKDFTEDTTLTDSVKEKMKECFGDKIDCEREDVELKLKWAQRNLGVNELVEAIQDIKRTADELNRKHKITKTVAAFFLGSLEKYVESHRKEEEAKHTLKPSKIAQVQRTKDVDEWEEHGYAYKTRQKIEQLSKEQGYSFDEWVRKFGFEESEPGIWKHKKTV